MKPISRKPGKPGSFRVPLWPLWLLALLAGAGALIDHGALWGLFDDDHPQYLRKDGTRGLDADWDAGGARTLSVGTIDVNDLAVFAADVNDLTVVAIDANTLTLTEGLTVKTLGLAGGSITDAGGTIDFNDEDLQGIGSLAFGDFTSLVPTGTAPFFCASTTLCANLNADLLDGQEASAFQAAGSYQTAAAGLSSLAELTYVSAAFVKLTAADTFTLDTATYYKSGDSPVFAGVDAGTACEADAYTVGGVAGISGTVPVYNDGTPGNLTSLTITNGIITGYTTAP
jgi:hypothetical protein